MTFRVADLKTQAAWGQLDRRGQMDLIRALEESYAELEQVREQVRELEARLLAAMNWRNA